MKRKGQVFIPGWEYRNLVLAVWTAVFLQLSSGPLAHAGEPTEKDNLRSGASSARTTDAGQSGSLQEAIHHLPPGGGKLTIPLGRYEIDHPLVLSRGDVMVQGSGTSTQILNRNENGEPALRLEPTQGSTIL